MLREGEIRIPSGCAITGFINRKGKTVSGEKIIRSIALMHDRSNGLGGGFAAYGIYPEFRDYYAFHLFYEDHAIRKETEEVLARYFTMEMGGPISTRKTKGISNPPLIWRYFVKPKLEPLYESELSANEYVVERVMALNSAMSGAYVFSSGKNMGAFKGVGYPEDIGEFYRLEEYEGYIWTAHGRFPTNTPGWWGGAHPFTLLDWSVVHNGEISSYDANRRYLEMFGYKCSLQTDTEAITYIFDLLIRKHGLPLDVAVATVAAPFWSEIDRMPPQKQKLHRAARIVYSSLLINGPFSVVLGSAGGIMALNDRIKLRPLTAAEHGDFLYVASEESAIREICPQPDRVWMPRGGEPVIGLLDESVAQQQDDDSPLALSAQQRVARA
ncbi:class II glutamine amidotransferase [Dethiobacter alkaliphilus]|uniref:Glutamine amidotransferase class-II n=1 Tax=Dethiobacter alkaliphilus AHT 1 TaxID=555088 RepID=C0GDH5_DETAL|nr:glutamine amidotransferase family protein [Dethiobacter alkaliphilus]EEG78696.1 glutamine amidotransferase class-II [Dethiobacter alkaliphilus AHT 1]